MRGRSLILISLFAGLSQHALASTDPDIWVTPGCQENPGVGRTDPDIWVVPPCSPARPKRMVKAASRAAPALGYPSLRALWNRGSPLTDGALEGSWKNVEVSTSRQCAVVANNAYDEQGLRNADGSIFELSFFSASDGLWVRPLSSAKGGADPSRVASEESRFTRPFSTRLTGDNGGSLDFACRSIGNKKDRMICGFTVVLDHPESASALLRECAQRANGTFQVYVRLK